MAGNEEEPLGQIYEDDEENEVQSNPMPDGVDDSDTNIISGGLAQQNLNPNIEYVTNFLYENNGNVYGMEVLVYANPNTDEDSFVIDKLTIVNQSEFNSWINLLGKLEDTYVPYTTGDLQNIHNISAKKDQYDNGEISWEDYNTYIEEVEWSELKKLASLEDILKNEETNITIDGMTARGYPVEINATKFMGMNSDEFSKVGHNHNYAPKIHSFTGIDGTYGVGSNDVYGHVKLINNLFSEDNVAGEALSAYQGKVLDDKIKEVSQRNAWLPVQTKGDYIQYKINPDLRLVVCNYNRYDFTGLSTSTGNHEIHKAGTIPNAYAPSSRVSIPMYRGDVVMYFATNGSINLYNLTKVSKINLYAQVMWHY